MRRPLTHLLLLMALPPLGKAQDPALREALGQGKSLWAINADRDGAAAKLREVTAALEPKARELSSEWQQVLQEARTWLALVEDRQPARRPEALKLLESILDLDPDYEFERNVLNARLQGHADAYLSGKYARVNLRLLPEGGVLTVDGKVRPTRGGLRHLIPGEHVLSYQKPGHKAATATVTLALRQEKAVELTAVRVSSTVTFRVSPAEVAVSVDGRPLGQTRGPAEPGAKAEADQLKVALADLSQPFVVEGLAPGAHTLELTAPCHRPKKVTIAKELIDPPADHALEPIRLTPAQGLLSLTSRAPGGEVFLDGKSLGPLPLQQAKVCPGKYLLRVEFPVGGFSRPIEVQDGEPLVLEANPKPRMAFLGLLGDIEFAGRERLMVQLGELPARIQSVALLPSTRKESLADALARIRLAKEAELVLWLEPSKIPGQLELGVVTLKGEEVRYPVKPLEQDPLGPILARLNHLPMLWEPDAGLRLVDVPGQGAWVLEASAAAVAAGIQPGASLESAGGKPLGSVAEFRALLQKVTGGSFDVVQKGKAITLPVSRSAVELPLQAEGFCYPLLLADLRLKRLQAKGDEAGYLRFHEAMVLMHFRKYDQALEVLREAKVNQVTGVSQGTLDYYTGLCLLRLGQVFLPEARQAFTQAAKGTQATLLDAGGPSVTPLARQMLEDIKP